MIQIVACRFSIAEGYMHVRHKEVDIRQRVKFLFFAKLDLCTKEISERYFIKFLRFRQTIVVSHGFIEEAITSI